MLPRPVNTWVFVFQRGRDMFLISVMKMQRLSPGEKRDLCVLVLACYNDLFHTSIWPVLMSFSRCVCVGGVWGGSPAQQVRHPDAHGALEMFHAAVHIQHGPDSFYSPIIILIKEPS